MKLGLKDIFEITVFSEEGKKIVTLDTIKEHEILKNGKCYFLIKDALLNTEMLNIFSEEETENLNDYEKMLANNCKKVYSFRNKQYDKTYKIIGKGYLRDVMTGENVICTFNIDTVKPVNKLDFKVTNEEFVDWDYIFEIICDKNTNEIYKFIIEQNK